MTNAQPAGARCSLIGVLLLCLVVRASAQAGIGSSDRRSVDDSPWRVELEGGALWQSRNDVQIPGDTGTRTSLDEVIGTGAFAVGRLTVDWDVSERNSLRFVYAPLSVDGNGSLSQPTDFNGTTFAPGAAWAGYRFDTYRLSWRYRFWQSERWTWRAGLTALVRDAEIELRQGTSYSSKTNTGVVPLLHVSGDWRFAERWNLAGVIDGAYASQGRAVDLSLKLGYDLSDRWRLSGGYRTIEGGSDGDDVYTFAWLHAAVVSLTYGF